jgi:hypothetical protein
MTMRVTLGAEAATPPLSSLPFLLGLQARHDLVDVGRGVEVLAAGLAELRVEPALRQHDHELLLLAVLELLRGLVERDVADRRGVGGVDAPAQILHLLARALHRLVEGPEAAERAVRALGVAVQEDDHLDRLPRVEVVRHEHDRLADGLLRGERRDVLPALLVLGAHARARALFSPSSGILRPCRPDARRRSTSGLPGPSSRRRSSRPRAAGRAR